MLINIAVIDLSVNGLYLYNVPKEFDSEQIEEFITSQGHRMSNCSWGEYNGGIVDLRDHDFTVKNITQNNV